MVFTGILAVATVGLGGATLGLYFTGERQIELNAKSAAAQSSDMKEYLAIGRAGALAESDQIL